MLSSVARRLHSRTIGFSLQRGDPVASDALRVLLATKEAISTRELGWFSGDLVWRLIWIEVLSWCDARQLEAPAGTCHALSTLIEHLIDSAELAEGSDDPNDLRRAVDELWT